MESAAVIGLDLAKNVFQVHGVAADGGVVVRRQLRRGQVLEFFTSQASCLVGMEACASAHHGAREIIALGHQVRLMPPAYVKAYVKRGKTDAADAEAIAEAVTRPTMRFVAVKSKAQQAALMLHKTRDLLMRQRTMLINALRGHLGEYGIITAQGAAGVRTALKALYLERDHLPELARAALHGLAAQLEALGSEIDRLEARIIAWHRQDETSRRLASIPGIGPITASAIAASAPDPSLFRSGRQFAPGSDLRRGRTAAAAWNAKSASAKWATAICVGCLSSARRPCSEWCVSAAATPGSLHCSHARNQKSRRSRSPTRPRASLGC